MLDKCFVVFFCFCSFELSQKRLSSRHSVFIVFIVLVYNFIKRTFYIQLLKPKNVFTSLKYKTLNKVGTKMLSLGYFLREKMFSFKQYKNVSYIDWISRQLCGTLMISKWWFENLRRPLILWMLFPLTQS